MQEQGKNEKFIISLISYSNWNKFIVLNFSFWNGFSYVSDYLDE